jgi:hypothetical protein
MRIVRSLLVICCALGVAAAGASADMTLGFFNVTNNTASDALIGEQQLFVDVIDPGGSQVLFTFRNEGPEASSITDIYFDDGTLLGIAAIDNSDPGVAFSQWVSPPNLPGGYWTTPKFNATAGFSVDSDPPVQPNGVNPGEFVSILFDLQGAPATTFADVIDDFTDGALRIGIHVQGFDSEGSESFVNVPVPAPGALVLGAMGLGLVTCVGRRVGK